MKIRGYEVGDEDQIPVRDGDWHRPFIAGFSLVAQMYTFELEDRIAAILGIHKLWDGVAECWQLTHPEPGLPVRKLAGEVTLMLDTWAAMEQVRRVNASAVNELQVKWAKLIGFEMEYVQRQAGPEGEDITGLVKWYQRRFDA